MDTTITLLEPSALPPHSPLPPLDPNSTYPWVLPPMLPQFCLLPSTSVGRRVVTMVMIRQDKPNPIISLTEKASNIMGESLSHQCYVKAGYDSGLTLVLPSTPAAQRHWPSLQNGMALSTTAALC